MLSEPPAQLPYNCGSLEQNSTAIRDNELHVESQIKIQLGHEHPESGALDHCSTIKQDASNDQEKHQECPSQNQEEQGKSVDSPQDTLPSVRLEGTGDGANTLMGETMRTGKGTQKLCLVAEENSIDPSVSYVLSARPSPPSPPLGYSIKWSSNWR